MGRLQSRDADFDLAVSKATVRVVRGTNLAGVPAATRRSGSTITAACLGGKAMRTRIWASGVVVVFVVPLLAAQVEFGAINGIVTDTSGTALPGVTMTLTGPDKRTAVTDGRGEFSFIRLRPGDYEIEGALPGFTTTRTKVSLTRGRTERLTIQMMVGGLTETVTVTGEAAVFDMQAMPRSVAAGGIGAGVVGGFSSRYAGPFNTEAYDHIEENRFRRVDVDPLSTFSIDVDTASYANVRRFLTDGAIPPAGAVRIEELINYFRFDYPRPSASAPFSITTELASCPWNPQHRLALIGLQGRARAAREPSPRNLVFLIDVSGSMTPADKLPLVRTAMRMLTDILTERDRVAIVVYAGASGLVLPSTSGDQKSRIHDALARLEAGGSTNGDETKTSTTTEKTPAKSAPVIR
jgi:Ca-activated chloride channel family protein